MGTRSPGSHLKCQQQEERFNAVETTIHKVSHEEVVGLRDVATHLAGGEDSAWSQSVPHRGSPFASQAAALLSKAHLTAGLSPTLHAPNSKLPLSVRGVFQLAPRFSVPQSPHTYSEQLLEVIELPMDVAAYLGGEDRGVRTHTV